VNKMSMRYQGKSVAENYDAVRSGRRRWRDENAAVEKLMLGVTGSVLDVACGTGRFFPLWKKMKLDVTGVDCSQAMLNEASKKLRTAKVSVQDAAELPFGDKSVDSVVCVRLLNLVDEPTLKKILGQLCRIAKNRVVLTIAMGDEYVLKKTTAIHVRKKFMTEVKRLGWTVVASETVLKWDVIRLERSK
jgi:ubiquinone/menaquinone biosynthesis C-methylase UbiE